MKKIFLQLVSDLLLNEQLLRLKMRNNIKTAKEKKAHFFPPNFLVIGQRKSYLQFRAVGRSESPGEGKE